MKHYRILVVEDEPVLAMHLADALAADGCDIVGPVGRLSQAVALLDDKNLDCAVLDVNISGGSTASVAGALLERGVPLLLTTGYGGFSLPLPLADLPRLTKPYSVDELVYLVRRLCDEHSQGSDQVH